MRNLHLAHFRRALGCKACNKILAEGSQPVRWTICDKCVLKVPWWVDAGPELMVLGVLAVGVLGWLWAALRGWI
jgi:hypothetical protein